MKEKAKVLLEATNIAKLLKRDDFRSVLEALLNSKPPVSIRRLSEDVGYPERLVRRRVSKLCELGVGFTVVINERRLGLSNLVVHLKEPYTPDENFRVRGLDEALKWILRWQANTITPSPWGILVFYVPLREDVVNEVARRVLSKLKVNKIFEADVIIQSRPSLSSIAYSNQVHTDWKWVKDAIFEAYRSGVTPSHFKRLSADEMVHMDALDILIVAALQRDALVSNRELARSLGFPVAKVRKHLNRHVESVLEGMRLKDYLFRCLSTFYLYAHGKGDPYSVSIMFEGLRKTFNFISGVYNSTTGEFMFISAVNQDELQHFTSTIYEVASRLAIEAAFSILLRPSIRSYTLPFLAFSRDERFWDPSVSVIDLMKLKLKDLLVRGYL
uniref:Winged helix-turn-helix transcriptional regulator n=1 Tax=Fervidicoccus fontis TaxID=683846 RepID=A0A7J3ZKK0_9CREN